MLINYDIFEIIFDNFFDRAGVFLMHKDITVGFSKSFKDRFIRYLITVTRPDIHKIKKRKFSVILGENLTLVTPP